MDIINPDKIEAHILNIRGEKVMLDADLAALFGVPTKAFNQAIRRNAARFPADFMFQLTAEERADVVTNCDHLSKLRFSSALPLAFTEHGAIMAATILNSPRAVETSVFIVRAFVRLKSLASAHKELAARVDDLERRLGGHDEALGKIVKAIQALVKRIDPPAKDTKRRIGFDTEAKRAADRPRGVTPRPKRSA